jgi:hypothetical protein
MTNDSRKRTQRKRGEWYHEHLSPIHPLFEMNSHSIGNFYADDRDKVTNDNSS